MRRTASLSIPVTVIHTITAWGPVLPVPATACMICFSWISPIGEHLFIRLFLAGLSSSFHSSFPACTHANFMSFSTSPNHPLGPIPYFISGVALLANGGPVRLFYWLSSHLGVRSSCFQSHDAIRSKLLNFVDEIQTFQSKTNSLGLSAGIWYLSRNHFPRTGSSSFELSRRLGPYISQRLAHQS